MSDWLKDLKKVSNDKMFLFLAFTSAMCITGVTLISPAVPSIAEGINVSESEIGLIITAFTLPSIFILPFSAYLADNFGRNKIMSIGCFLLGFGGLAAYFATSLETLVFTRVLQGVGLAGVMPLTVVVIGDLYSGSKEATAQGLRGTSNKIGSILWSVIGGSLVAFGWNTVFLVYGVFIPLGVIAFFKAPSETGNTKKPVSYIKDISSSFQDLKIIVYLFLGFARMFNKYAIITYIPILLTNRYEMAAATIGILLALRGVGGMISSSMAGLIDRKIGKKKAIAVAFISMGLLALLVASTEATVIVIGMLFAYGLMDSMFSSLHKSLLNHSVEDEHRAGLINANGLMQNLGATTAPVLIGAMLFLGTEIWLYVVMSIAVMAALIFISVEKLKS